MSRLRNIAVVAFSQAPIVTRDEHRVASEILYPEVRSALDQCDVERAAIDYQVAGSADYIDGRPFGFVAALDVMGSWPAKQDLHLEMDAAFAAYYAWVRMQAGDCDTALAHVVRDDLDRLRVGARVEAVWAVERRGTIRDIECFRLLA